MIDIGYPYYIFGSHDSLDVDVMIDHPQASGDETKDKAIFIELKTANPVIAAWNVNIIRIEDGMVVSSIPSKGSPDSVHNSLYSTYEFHSQAYPFPLNEPVKRDLVLAIIKCNRAILSCFKKTKRDDFYKQQIQKVLRNGSWEDRVNVLSLLDYEVPLYDEPAENLNSYKRIAFYIGQALSLFDGIEIYTKDALIKHHPELGPLIRRELVPVNDILKKKIGLLQNVIMALRIEQTGDYTVRFNEVEYDYKHEQSVKKSI